MLTRRAAIAFAAALPASARAATSLRIGLLHTVSPAPFYIARERGYFADEGIEAVFRFFESAQPIAAAAVAGDIDIGATALTGGFFSLAAKGALVVIGGGLHEQRGFPGSAVIAAPQAFAAGLTTLDRLAGHSFAITQYGSSFHYMLARIAQARGFDLKSVTLRPVQQVPNMIAAVRTGQVDATIAIASLARPLDQAGEARIIAWVGDTVPYQITAVFTTRAMISAGADTLRRFARAYQRGIMDFRAAFLPAGPSGPLPPESASESAIPLIQKYVLTNDSGAAAKIREGAGWYDADGALDVADVGAQLRWFQSEGLVKDPVAPESVIDTSFFPLLTPAK